MKPPRKSARPVSERRRLSTAALSDDEEIVKRRTQTLANKRRREPLYRAILKLLRRKLSAPDVVEALAALVGNPYKISPENARQFAGRVRRVAANENIIPPNKTPGPAPQPKPAVNSVEVTSGRNQTLADRAQRLFNEFVVSKEYGLIRASLLRTHSIAKTIKEFADQGKTLTKSKARKVKTHAKIRIYNAEDTERYTTPETYWLIRDSLQITRSAAATMRELAARNVIVTPGIVMGVRKREKISLNRPGRKKGPRTVEPKTNNGPEC